MGKLDNKIAILTGVSSGTGRAAAKLFASEGATVIGLARRAELLDTLKDEIEAEGNAFVPMPCDITDSAATLACVEKTVELYGRVDILCNFAGITDHLRFVHQVNDEVYERIMDGNLRGPFNACWAVIPQMVKQNGGAIVNCSSIGGVKGYGGGAVYSMAKHALVGLGRVIAAEYFNNNIRCNTVCPGGINTAMGTVIMDPSKPENLDEDGRLIAQNYLETCFPYFNSNFQIHNINVQSDPEDQAKVFLFLASDDSKFITGEEIIVAGGAVQR